MENEIRRQLAALNVIDENQVVTFYPAVRDNKDVAVMRCNKSGVIFLSTLSHIQKAYYTEKEGTSYWSADGREQALKSTYDDDYRRYNQFRHLVTNKNYLDIGSGLGGILDLLKPFAAEVSAVEPQRDIRLLLNELGYPVFESVSAIPATAKFEVVSLFHVFEHLVDPLTMLKDIADRMCAGGKIIIEVPHANDALITSFDLDAFKRFTFWSEHLILHTRQSLSTFLQEAGFKNITVKGVQRYPLANHLNWLHKGEPGGHDKLHAFRNASLEEAYANVLKSLDQTDTIIAIAEKP
ncbi:MAG: class I SAM-dependent methyltransferase [Bacteroidetes bacterium]|nr:class I SAM-dependent methyltransferase [Bacteroidota bacterium]